MVTMNTTDRESVSFVIDPETEEHIKQKDNLLKFQNLVLEWKKESRSRSSVREMASLPSYLKIIGMGEAALPLILNQLKSEGDTPDHWFWALASIVSDENPVPAESRGKLPEMARAWVEWGQEKGYIEVG